MRTNSWDLVAWDHVQKSIVKFQKKILAASLLKEIGRVHFLQKKFIESRLVKLWVTHQITLQSEMNLTSSEKYWIVTQLELNDSNQLVTKKKKKDLISLVKKSSILLLKSVLEPQWISNLKLNSPYYNCMESLIEEITRITATNVKQFVFTVNLDSYLHLVDQKLILKNINSSIYLKRKCQEILKNNFFESYQHIKINYYMTDKKLPELQFGNLLVDILFHEFKSLFGRYIQKYILIHKQIPINKKQYSLRYLCNFIFIDSDYGYLKNIRYLFVNWIKKIGISLKSNETKIKSIDRWFHILQFSLIQVQKNNQRRIKIKPSISAQRDLLDTLSKLNHRMKNSIITIYIDRVSIILKKWAEYFKVCNCKKTLNKLDNQIFEKLRTWAFKRHARWSKQQIKLKYFPNKLKLKYFQRIYHGNWILSYRDSNVTDKIFIEKLRWNYKRNYFPRLKNNKINYLNFLYQSHTF